MRIHTISVTPFQQNARILFDEQNQRCVVVDPGGDISEIRSAMESYTLEGVLLTHAHIDHAGGVAALMERYPDASLIGHREDAPLRETIAQQATYFGLSSEEFQNCPDPTRFVAHGDTLSVLSESSRVLFVPGHAPGHVCYYFETLTYELSGEFAQARGQRTGPVLIGGDALFAGSIGRTDLPFGDYAALMRSILGELMSLPDETLVLTGHGPDTTIGAERKSNPFILSALDA